MYEPQPIKRNSSFYKNYWEAYSPKLNRDVCYLGQANYELWLLIEINHEIISFCERPLIISGVSNKKKIEVIPNFWLKYKNGQESLVIIEASKSEKQKREITFLAEWCKNNNTQLQVKEYSYLLKNQLLINNAKRIIPYLSNSYPLDLDIHKVSKCLSFEKRTIKTILNELKDSLTEQRIIVALYNLIFNNKIASNLHLKPLNINTEVWLHCPEDESQNRTTTNY